MVTAMGKIFLSAVPQKEKQNKKEKKSKNAARKNESNFACSEMLSRTYISTGRCAYCHRIDLLRTIGDRDPNLRTEDKQTTAGHISLISYSNTTIQFIIFFQ